MCLLASAAGTVLLAANWSGPAATRRYFKGVTEADKSTAANYVSAGDARDLYGWCVAA